MKTIRAADLFCGAGGTSTGLVQAVESMGAKLELTAVNHWEVAIETHSANHPEARHLCESLDGVDPRKVVGGQLDILVASPECTHHSVARGGRPMCDQSRSTAWHVLRWAEALRPKAILVENVPEFRDWGPIGADGRPLKSKKGHLFQSWLASLHALGYHTEIRLLTAADYGDATTRRRLFVMARLGRKPTAPTRTHAPAGELFEQVKPWRTAREIIDWSLVGESIFSRKKPLAEKTLKRIEAGLRKFGGEPFLAMLYGTGNARSVGEPLPTVTATGQHIALCEPFLLGQQSGATPRGVSEPVPTVSTKGAISLVEPFLVHYYGNGEAQPVTKPLATVTTRDRFGLVEPDCMTLDIRFRMLQPHELAAAMSFPERYRFAGTKTDVVKQIGNAVPVGTARALTHSLLTGGSYAR